MKLQTDPTVEYGLGIKQTADRPLTYAEVATASPYNTYIHPGLPPTPIASPGAASLKAALYPEKPICSFCCSLRRYSHIQQNLFPTFSRNSPNSSSMASEK